MVLEHDPKPGALPNIMVRRKNYSSDGRIVRSSASSRAFSSGRAATTTLVAPASWSTAATAAEMQHCGKASAEISRPSARIVSRKACALRRE